MPFEVAPRITTNPWTEQYPREARALVDLAAHIRNVSPERWNYERVGFCGSVGCALGHAVSVKSCKPFLVGDKSALNPTELELPRHIQDAFFFGHGGSFAVGRMQNVTAAMVADRIDHWLATGEIR